MTISKEITAYDLYSTSWSGAADRVKDLTVKELEIIMSTLEEIYPDGMNETELNDFLWFEDDTYAEWLGYEDAEALWTRTNA